MLAVQAGQLITFVIASMITIGGAVGVIAFRNPVHNALSLIATLFGMAVLYAAQGAYFVAAIGIAGRVTLGSFLAAVAVGQTAALIAVVALLPADERRLGALRRPRSDEGVSPRALAATPRRAARAAC